jgi:acetolactate synthase-1/3 small subunit
MRHTISVLVENKFGVLARVAGLFSGRGYNIETLSVAPTIEADVSLMTIVTRGEDSVIEQVIKQLNKLIDVIKVSDLTVKTFVEREMVLLKVAVEDEKRSEVLRVVDIFRGRIIDMSPRGFIIEVTGTEDKINALLTLLKPLGLKEIARTGYVAMIRTDQPQKT